MAPKGKQVKSPKGVKNSEAAKPQAKTVEKPKSILKKSPQKPKEPSLSDIESDSGLDDEDEFEMGSDVDSESEDDEEEDEDEEDDKKAGSNIDIGAEDEADENEDDDSDDSFPLRKKKKTDDGKGTFANAFNAIISSKLKAYDRNDPILARNKSKLKKLESDKLEAKAKRLMNLEHKAFQEKGRVKNLLPSATDSDNVREALEKEKRLRKVAQRGVVKLFNAVLATQVGTEQDLASVKKKDEVAAEISKSRFLDLVKAAGDE